MEIDIYTDCGHCSQDLSKIKFTNNHLSINDMKVGDSVIKKSKKPFKSGKQIEVIVSFGTNEVDPKKRPCVIFTDGSNCNLEMIELINQ